MGGFAALYFALSSTLVFTIMLLFTFFLLAIGREDIPTFVGTGLAILAPVTGRLDITGPIVVIGPQLAVIAGVLVSMLLGKEWLLTSSRKRNNHIGVLVISLLALPFLSTFTSNYTDYVHLLPLYCSNILFSFSLFMLLKQSSNNIRWASWGILIAATVATIIALQDWDGLQRLSLDGNVRAVANVYGAALMLLLIPQLLPDANGIRAFPLSTAQLPRLALILALGVLLAATASRGVLLAIIIMTTAAIAANIRANMSRSSIVNTAILLLLIGTVLLLYELPSSLRDRVAMDVSTDGRFAIWGTALAQLRPIEVMFGAGLNRFPSLSPSGMYAHSVFLDHFASFGLTGITILVGMFASLGIMVARYSSVAAGCIGLYICAAYATHGHINTISYWVLLALAFSVAWGARRKTASSKVNQNVGGLEESQGTTTGHEECYPALTQSNSGTK